MDVGTALEWLALVEHELLLFAGFFFLIGAVDEDGRPLTTLDGGDAARVFDVDSAVTLTLQNLTKTYAGGHLRAVDGLDIDIADGEFLVLVVAIALLHEGLVHLHVPVGIEGRMVRNRRPPGKRRGVSRPGRDRAGGRVVSARAAAYHCRQNDAARHFAHGAARTPGERA